MTSPARSLRALATLLGVTLGLAWLTALSPGPLLPRAAGEGEAAVAATRSGLVLVELFTSEGCSSCPPADALLAELATEAERGGAPLACVSFHVDYWDRLGWADPFGDPEFTARQRRYALALRGDGLYTPQLVVDGRRGLVGSDRARVRDALDEALARPRGRDLGLGAVVERDDQDALAVVVTLAAQPEEVVVNAALVERARTSRPGRGENAGVTLRHACVARSAAALRLDRGAAASPPGAGVRPASGPTPGPVAARLRLRLPADLDPAGAHVVAWVARTQDLATLGAMRAPLPPR